MADQHDRQKIPQDTEFHTRDCLKKSFASGKLPTAKRFGELIDSTFNMNVEGFNKSAEHGFEISTQGTSSGLVRFFRGLAEDPPADPGRIESSQCQKQLGIPVWSMRLDQHGEQNLTLMSALTEAVGRESQDGDAETGTLSEVDPTLSLDPKGRVGVHTDSPGCELDINGTMRCTTRLGNGSLRSICAAGADKQDYAPIAADGEWHNITSAMTGCQALEIVAGVGKKDSGRYALLHAIALNTFNPTGWLFNFLGLKNRIRCRHSYYRSRTDKLALRWAGENRCYFLQIRSNGDYGVGPQGTPIRINYHITRLWTDPRMKQSWDVEADR